MIKLVQVVVNKYKSILKPQTVEIDPSITTIVGMNEAGKTGFLTAIAKTNYFNEDDEDFIFDVTQDYPRSELIDFQDSGEKWEIINCKYEVPASLLEEIKNDIGEDVFTKTSFTYSKNYNPKDKSVGATFTGITTDLQKFIIHINNKYALSETTKKSILNIKSIKEILSIEGNAKDVDLADLKVKIKAIIDEAFPWDSLLDGYVAKKWIKSKMPKFWYFDDYYPLKGKININKLSNKTANEESEKTSKALFELAKIDPKEILNNADYEKYIALLEASSNKITNEIFKYWSANKNLSIDFKIQDITNDQGVPEKFLDIRVKSQRHQITLPLDRRSKGFNWFFSFIIWFSKIQADKNSDYVLLLDEPGLSLHASAQADLLRFFAELSKKYQIIYTTHSPFMVETEHLDRVRTCFETDDGTIISDSIQEKDPNTLFPLQAALGYDIAQNLFVSKNNLLVEGPADLIYLTVLSSILESEKREFLKENITIVPVGGLDKVTTFISLLRGSKLNVACLLDTFTDQKGKQKVDDLIMHKIIKEKHIRFFNEFANNGKATADIEDLFDKSEYLKLFNAAFDKDYPEIKPADLDTALDTIIKQINKVIGKDRFNHYRPANKLNQLGVDKNYFSKETLDRFEVMFKEINALF